MCSSNKQLEKMDLVRITNIQKTTVFWKCVTLAYPVLTLLMMWRAQRYWKRLLKLYILRVVDELVVIVMKLKIYALQCCLCYHHIFTGSGPWLHSLFTKVSDYIYIGPDQSMCKEVHVSWWSCLFCLQWASLCSRKRPSIKYVTQLEGGGGQRFVTIHTKNTPPDTGTLLRKRGGGGVKNWSKFALSGRSLRHTQRNQ
jgi:hypothetical protein